MKSHIQASCAAALLAACSAGLAADTASSDSTDPVQRGRYLVRIAGCNDCHTPNYGPSLGQVDEKLWLTGDRLGWSGPWGTTYATNLRLRLAGLSEEQWLHLVRNMQPRPPMPWFNVRSMSEADLKAIYAYTRAMGAAGEPAPAYVPPGGAPTGPVVRFPQ